MKKCLVIGGGFAGLASAVYLSRAGLKVEVIEASPKPGGRAYSFNDPVTGDEVDNGQHIMMGCYNETLNFLSLIGSSSRVEIQQNLEVIFLKESFKQYRLNASGAVYPFNLLRGLLNYNALTLSERFLLLKFFAKLYTYNEARLKQMTVKDWLSMELQTENIIKSFWEILTAGALNTNIQNASALIFSETLKQIFFRGNKAASIVLPKEGLSRVYCDGAVKFIENRGGRMSLSEKVEQLTVNNDKLIEIKTNKRTFSDFDFVISAVPHHALRKIKGSIPVPDINFSYGTIISLNAWLKINPLKERFYGLINSPVHWIFNHWGYVSLVISAADHLAGLEKSLIAETARLELEKYTPIKRGDITHISVVKEKRATIIPSNDILDKRPGTATQLSNFFLAGDWTDTGLPATIEGAVKSGRTAAEKIILSDK